MNGFDRIHDVHRLFKGRKTALPLVDVLDALECSKATFFRLKRHMTDYLGAPLVFDRNLGGYRYDENADEGYELPGVWFNEQELHALLLIQSLAANFNVLKDVLVPIEERFNALLGQSSIHPDQLKSRVRFLGVALRHVENHIFAPMVTATLQHQRVRVDYCRRDSGEPSQRELSPQRVINYRNNWYLDAWCHTREALRTFSLECIESVSVVNREYHDMAEAELDDYFQKSYGVYAGGRVGLATLLFKACIARRIADEEWHPKQCGRFLDNGDYELQLPFNEEAPDELIHDVLAQGPHAKIIAPESLVNALTGKLKAMLAHYPSG